jgi:hypothetical protein
MDNLCYVISREQVSLDLNIVECRNVAVARQLINENRMHYVDSVHLTLDDLRLLSNKVGKSVGDDRETPTWDL